MVWTPLLVDQVRRPDRRQAPRQVDPPIETRSIPRHPSRKVQRLTVRGLPRHPSWKVQRLPVKIGVSRVVAVLGKGKVRAGTEAAAEFYTLESGRS